MFQWVAFGKVKYDNAIFNEDVLISTAGDVYERQWDEVNTLTMKEIDSSIDADTKTLLVGTGHYGTLGLSPQVKKMLKEEKIDLIEKKTPDATKYYNKRMSVRGRKPKITAIIKVA